MVGKSRSMLDRLRPRVESGAAPLSECQQCFQVLESYNLEII